MMYSEAADALAAKFIQGQGIFSENNKINTQAIMKEKLEVVYNFYDLFNIQDEGNKEEFNKKIQSMFKNIPLNNEQIKDTHCQFLHWITNNMHLSGEEIYRMLSSYDDSIKNSETLDEVIECIKQDIL